MQQQDTLLGEYHAQASELRSQVDHLQATVIQLEQEIERLNEMQMLAAKSPPDLAPAISASIRDSREHMIDALYPIVGALVARAVSEAFRAVVQRTNDKLGALPAFKVRFQRSLTRFAGVSKAKFDPENASSVRVLLKPVDTPEWRNGLPTPLRRYDPEIRLAPAARITAWLVVLVFVMALWRLWHTYYSTSFEIPAATSLVLVLYHRE